MWSTLVGCGAVSPGQVVDSGDPAPTVVTDRFAADLTPVDVLLVVDDSKSMSDEQPQLLPGLYPLVDALVQVGGEFRLGVTTTDLGDDQDRLAEVDGARWLDASTPDPEAWFEAALPQELGLATEQGSGAVFLTLERSDDADFHRPDAALHALVVSDEPDYTRDGIISAAGLVDGAVELVDEPSAGDTFEVTYDAAGT